MVLVLQILAKEGDTVTPGTKVAVVAIGEAGAASAAPPPPKEAAAAPPPPKAQAAAPPPPPAPKAAPAAAPPPKAAASKSPAEVQLPPKGGERRVSPELY